MIVSEAIDATHRSLQGVHRGQYNFLAASIEVGDVEAQFEDDLKGLTPGALIAIDDELCYVRSVTVASKLATLQRGWLGTQAAHHAAGTSVEVAPRWPRVEVRRALLDEIRSWGSSIYRVDSLTIAPEDRTISLAAFDVRPYRVLGAYRGPRSGSTTDLAMQYRVTPPSPSHVDGAVVFNEKPSADVTLTVALPFALDAFTDATDMEADIGLGASMLDIPPIGAAWRLLSPREFRRLDLGSQGEPRSAQEVQAGMMAAVARGYKQLRDTRLADEAYRLASLYPWKL